MYYSIKREFTTVIMGNRRFKIDKKTLINLRFQVINYGMLIEVKHNNLGGFQ
ncbi:hypothetical protein J14TS2_49500 [Bacillus sp. J14TS2]|nr:hypothetical protein J14TS2_49500 [Bacillus sp. J14TS2]